MLDSSDTFTQQDQQTLQELVDKYGGDVRHMRRELASTRHVASTAKGQDGQQAVWREYFSSHPRADESDREKVRELSSKLHMGNVKSAHVPTRAALDEALEDGWLSDEEHAQKLRDETRRVIRDGQRTARELMKHLADLAECETFEAVATPKDKRNVIDKFSVESEWEKTKDDYRVLYNASSIQRKVELKQRHPELHSAVFGR